MVLAFGTRPEIIKMAPLVWELSRDPEIDLVMLDTGQHFDWEMSGSFISQLGLPQPKFRLGVGSGGQATQTGKIVEDCQVVLEGERPDVVLVQGDTNSSLGVALAAAKLGFAVGHVEAGCRSFDRTMPEELNRVLIADLATIHFAPTQRCVENLLREGVDRQDIFLVGHPIVDLLEMNGSFMSRDPLVLGRLGLEPKSFYFFTLHRRENVDDPERLRSILAAVSEAASAEGLQVVFPVHPHTTWSVQHFGLGSYLERQSFLSTSPVAYPESLTLIRNSRLALTDSGGVQQEAALLGTPCITLRETTEWMETVEAGVNFLGLASRPLPELVKSVEGNMREVEGAFRQASGVFGRPPVARRILEVLKGDRTLRQ